MRKQRLLIISLAASSFGMGGACNNLTTSQPTAKDAHTRVPIPRADASVLTEDAVQPLGWIDYVVDGCKSGEGTEASPCIGISPLNLRFAALAPADIDIYSWNFGDQSPLNSSITPTHRFERPGTYAISLNVEGPGGTAGITQLSAIVVTSAPLASACNQDLQCASNDCACTPPSSCPNFPSGSSCFLSCESHASCGDNLCIDLSLGNSSGEDWRRKTCIPKCTANSPLCPKGSHCQALRGVEGNLQLVCFPTGQLLPIGASCLSVNGELDHSACGSGICLSLEGRGICSERCSVRACPTGSACATFNDGVAPHCLADCDLFSCEDDPQFQCQSPGIAFEVAETPSAAGYCSTR